MRRCINCRDIIGSDHKYKEVKCSCGNLSVYGGGYIEKNRHSSVEIYSDYHDGNTKIEDLRKEFKEEEKLCLAITMWAFNSMNKEQE